MVEAEFVDDQQVEARPVTHAFCQSLVGQRGGEIRQQFGAGRVADSSAGRAEAAAQCLKQMTFSDSTLADDDQILAAADEVSGGQLFDLHAVDTGFVELPVEVFERLDLVETGVADAAFDASLAAPVRLPADQQAQEVQVRQGFVFSTPQSFVKLFGGDGDAQRFEVGQELITTVRCRAGKGVRRLFLRCAFLRCWRLRCRRPAFRCG